MVDDMKLSSLFVQGNQTYREGSIQGNQTSLEQGLQNGLEELAGMTKGQSVTGEILEKNGNDVLLAIGKNQLLRAKLDGSMAMEEGQQVTFTIKNMSGGKVVLSPLFANLGRDLNKEKALQMAGLPRNGISLKTVQTMMQEGMPIDRESLRQMLGTVESHSAADIETVVQLKKLGIPVTEETIFQLDAYKNYRHQMTEGLLEIADSLKGTLQEMTAGGKTKEGIALLKEVLSLLTETEAESSVSIQQEASFAQGEAVLTGEEIGTLVQSEAEGEAGESIKNLLPETKGGKETVQPKEEVQAESTPSLTKEETARLALQLKQAGLSEETVLSFQNGEITGKELLCQVKLLLEKQLSREFLPKEQKESLSQLLEGKEWNALLKKEMAKEWLLAPEEVGKDKTVEALYRHLNNQMNRLNQALLQAFGENTPLAKTVSNVAGNIDFMNQLNQMFTYVQLPLKLQNREANGELYVYTNKKSLAAKEGEVSALLHLDMEHLGSVNVHVSMREQKVATKFYLQDDSALDLIASHIDLLNDRLNKRGYTMNASFQIKEDEHTVIEEILQRDKPVSVLYGYSFDARA